jgi:hypothetical protein
MPRKLSFGRPGQQSLFWTWQAQQQAQPNFSASKSKAPGFGEPVPFSTKKGIDVIGVVQDVAPLYSPNAPGLVPESQIAALDKTMKQILEDQKEPYQLTSTHTQPAIPLGLLSCGLVDSSTPSQAVRRLSRASTAATSTTG